MSERPIPLSLNGVFASFEGARSAKGLTSQFSSPSNVPPRDLVVEFLSKRVLANPFTKVLIGAYPSDTVADLSLTIGHEGIRLCNSAESRLYEAVRLGAAGFVVDHATKTPVLLIKYLGKLSGVSLTDFDLPNGQTIHAGNWYVPTDQDVRKSLEQQFKPNHNTNIMLLEGNWALMRPYRVKDGDPAILPRNVSELTSLEIFRRIAEREFFPASIEDEDGRSRTLEEFRAIKFEDLFK